MGVQFFEFFVEDFQAFKLGCEAAFGGCVDHEDDFVFEGREGIGLARFCGAVEVGLVRGLARGGEEVKQEGKGPYCLEV